MGVVEAAQGTEERRQDLLHVGVRGGRDPAGDEGGGVLQRPDVADDRLRDPQRQVFEVVVGAVGHQEEDGQVLEAVPDPVEDLRPAGRQVRVPAGGRSGRGRGGGAARAGGGGRAGQVPGHHGGGDARLRLEHRAGVPGVGRPAQFQSALLQFLADPAQLLDAHPAAERVLAQGQQHRAVRHGFRPPSVTGAPAGRDRAGPVWSGPPGRRAVFGGGSPAGGRGGPTRLTTGAAASGLGPAD